MVFDKLFGLFWLPLTNNENLASKLNKDLWYSLDTDLCKNAGTIIGTKNPTGHSILLNIRIEQSQQIELNLNESNIDEFQHNFDSLINDLLIDPHHEVCFFVDMSQKFK